MIDAQKNGALYFHPQAASATRHGPHLLSKNRIGCFLALTHKLTIVSQSKYLFCLYHRRPLTSDSHQDQTKCGCLRDDTCIESIDDVDDDLVCGRSHESLHLKWKTILQLGYTWQLCSNASSVLPFHADSSCLESPIKNMPCLHCD